MNIDRSLTAKRLGTRSSKIEFIVLHDTAGNGGSGDAKYLANDPEDRGVSVDFCILKDGTIHQLNPDLRRRVTFHAGRRTRFRGRTNGGVNQHSIGIEIAQKARMEGLSPAYPPIQVKAVAQVCAHICKEFALTKFDITTHSKIITDGSRSDPRNFPWEQFWIEFNVASAGGPTTHTVIHGETLWFLSQKYTTTVEKLKSLNNLDTASNTIIEGQTLIVKE